MSDIVSAISVIVPAHGVAHLLPEALCSLQHQDFRDWEAIVVDDGSPDDVAGAVACFADDARIRLLKTDHGGVAVARNRAIASSSAPLIALLDGDDLYEPDYLSTMMAAIEADPAIGLVTCDAIIFGPGRSEGRRFSKGAPQGGPITLDRLLSRSFNVYVGSTFRRTAFEQVGGFDESLPSGEDLDLWFRLMEADWMCTYIARPLARYRRRPNSLSSNTPALLESTRRVYEKAAHRLQGCPEEETAIRMLGIVNRKISWSEGESLIRNGQPRDGIKLLIGSGADRRSLRWRVAITIMQVLPWLAPALIRMRMWLPPLSQSASEW